MGLLLLLWGLIFEFGDWLVGGKGIIGKIFFDHAASNHSAVPLYLQNPFLSLYFILPAAAYSSLLKDQVKDFLSRGRAGEMATHPRIELLSRFLKFISVLIFLFTSVKIWKSITLGNAGGADTLFTPGSHGFIFLFGIIVNALVFYLVLRNLPEPAEVTEPILQRNSTGLYALNSNQFALEIIIGRSEKPEKILGPATIYKDKNRRWYVFSAGDEEYSQEAVSVDIGPLNVSYSYWVTVTDDPQNIDTKQITLTSVEAKEQLHNEIKRSTSLEFEKWIGEQDSYQNIVNEARRLFGGEEGEGRQATPVFGRSAQNSSNFAYTPEERLSQVSGVNLVRYELSHLQTKLRQEGKQDHTLFGYLFNLRFQIVRISFTPQTDTQLTQIQNEAEKAYRDSYDRDVKENREFALQHMAAVSGLLEKLEGRVPREALNEMLKRLMGSTMNAATLRQGQQRPQFAPHSEAHEPPLLGSDPLPEENALTMPISIEAIVKRVEPELKHALTTYSDTTEAIKSVLPAIAIARKLDNDSKTKAFEQWSDSKIGKLKSGNAKDVLETFLREQQNAGYIISE